MDNGSDRTSFNGYLAPSLTILPKDEIWLNGARYWCGVWPKHRNQAQNYWKNGAGDAGNLKKMNVEDERNHGEDSIGCASWSLDVRRSKVDRDRNR
ncbi:unnamed protein product [Caenorhabditis angaria]|uniref:Uncharacterized protein n=1 Tax=Caenorhabditis angaria TaxID=860376 RepID=A0A9P1IZ34_9PELO|nr:unnamed protein product [Caenorhabditis angaria]